MRQALFTIATFGLCSLLLATGCKKEDETQQPNTAANMQGGYQQQPGGYQQQPGGYQQQPGGYQQQPQGGYQQPPPGGYQQPPPNTTPQQGATAPAGGAASPPPNALATPCKSDAECIGAKCNLQAQKCQFPCGSNNDCQTGWACMMGACAPSMNTQQQTQ
jgi:hypothetical protein